MKNEEKKIIIEKALILVKDAISKGVSKYRIANDTSINETTIGNYANGKNSPSFANAKILLDYFNSFTIMDNGGSITVENDIIEKGNPYKEDGEDNSTGPKKEIEENRGFTTYLLPMSAMGGSLTGFAAQGVTLQNCEAVVSPIENVDFAITVYGESMAPEYPSGSRILIKKINPAIFIDWGKAFVLDTPNGVIVKEIHESSKEGFISCHSINTNPKFKPFNVPMDEIFGMYRVLMCLSAK